MNYEDRVVTTSMLQDFAKDTSGAFAIPAGTLEALSPDALHVASAEASGADVFLSTDDRQIRRVARRLGHTRIPVFNPLSWVKELGL